MSIIATPLCPSCGERIEWTCDWENPQPLNHDCSRGAITVQHRTIGGKGTIGRVLRTAKRKDRRR